MNVFYLSKIGVYLSCSFVIDLQFSDNFENIFVCFVTQLRTSHPDGEAFCPIVNGTLDLTES